MGNGVDFMMGSHKWHGVAPNDEQLKVALVANSLVAASLKEQKQVLSALLSVALLKDSVIKFHKQLDHNLLVISHQMLLVVLLTKSQTNLNLYQSLPMTQANQKHQSKLLFKMIKKKKLLLLHYQKHKFVQHLLSKKQRLHKMIMKILILSKTL